MNTTLFVGACLVGALGYVAFGVEFIYARYRLKRQRETSTAVIRDLLAEKQADKLSGQDACEFAEANFITKLEHAQILNAVYASQAELYRRDGSRFVRAHVKPVEMPKEHRLWVNADNPRDTYFEEGVE